MATTNRPKGWLEATGDAGHTGVRCAFRFRLWQSQRRCSGEPVVEAELKLGRWPASEDDSPSGERLMSQLGDLDRNTRRVLGA